MANNQVSSPAQQVRVLRIVQIVFPVGNLGAALLFAFAPAAGFPVNPLIQSVSAGGFVLSAVIVYFVIGSQIKKIQSVETVIADPSSPDGNN